jgi:hypothetical protein
MNEIFVKKTPKEIEEIIKEETIKDLTELENALFNSSGVVRKKVVLLDNKKIELYEKLDKLKKNKEYFEICIDTIYEYDGDWSVEDLKNNIKNIDKNIEDILPDLERLEYVLSILEDRENEIDKKISDVHKQRLDLQGPDKTKKKNKSKRRIISRKLKSNIIFLFGLMMIMYSSFFGLSYLPYELCNILNVLGVLTIFYTMIPSRIGRNKKRRWH